MHADRSGNYERRRGRYGWAGATLAAVLLLYSCISGPTVQELGDGVVLRAGSNRVQADAGTYTIWYVRECGPGAPLIDDLVVETDGAATVLDIGHRFGTYVQDHGCVMTIGAVRLASKSTIEVKVRWINEPIASGYLLMVEGNEGNAR